MQVLIADVLFSQEASKQGIKISDDEVMQTIRTQFGLVNFTDEQIKQMIEKQGTNWGELLSSMKRSLSSQKLVLKQAQPRFLKLKLLVRKKLLSIMRLIKLDL